MLLSASLLFLAAASTVHGRLAEEHMAKEEPAGVAVSPAVLPAPPPALFVATPSAPPAPTPNPHSCFQAPRSMCPSPPVSCRAVNEHSVLCCDIDNVRLKEGLVLKFNSSILSLHILNATLEELDVGQAVWKTLISLSVTDGHIKKIIGNFKKQSHPACLNISNNGLSHIEPRALVNLFNLTTLDMSRNNLTEMPHFNGRQRDFALDIRGNNEMLCRSVLDALKRYGGHLNFLNVNTTFCTSSKMFNWFNTTELVSIRQVEIIHELKNDCPEVSTGGANCLCSMVRVDIVPGKPPSFSVGVDCSNRNLDRLPDKLPPNTILLNVSYNNITSLAPLSDYPSYEHVRGLNADFNKIHSIVELEGTRFFDNFIELSLRSNKLKSIPTYILSNTFDRNWLSRTIHLAKNYLHCDCTTAKVLKEWLRSNSKHIPDYDEIYCENIQVRVIDLVESKMCQQQQRVWTDYVYYVIATEVLLLIVLIAKVSYDYWVFKSAGYLPWPASKMPKLPCDCLCE